MMCFKALLPECIALLFSLPARGGSAATESHREDGRGLFDASPAPWSHVLFGESDNKLLCCKENLKDLHCGSPI